MKPANFYGGGGDGDDNFGETPSSQAEVIRDIFANADGKQRDRENDGISFGELWKRNGNNNLYLLGTLVDAALIEERGRDESDEWMAVLSTNELASIAVKNPSQHFQKKRKSDMDGVMTNGWNPSNNMKGRPVNSGSQPGQDEDKGEMKALMMTSKRVNGGNGGSQDGGGLLLLSRGQWKTLYSLQASVIEGAQAWLKKIFRGEVGGERTCGSKDMRDSSTSLQKWASMRYISKRKGKQVDKKNNPTSIRIDITRDSKQTRNQDGVIMSSFEDFLLEETLNLYYEGDMIKIRVAMFCKPEVSSCSQLEIDLVQSFVCETETQKKSRRRIAKVLKRDLITDLIWQKGISSTGVHFLIYCTHFEIPEIFPLESSLEKFRTSSFEYELRIRFFCEDAATSTCSFPLNIYVEMLGDVADA